MGPFDSQVQDAVHTVIELPEFATSRVVATHIKTTVHEYPEKRQAGVFCGIATQMPKFKRMAKASINSLDPSGQQEVRTRLQAQRRIDSAEQICDELDEQWGGKSAWLPPELRGQQLAFNVVRYIKWISAIAIKNDIPLASLWDEAGLLRMACKVKPLRLTERAVANAYKVFSGRFAPALSESAAATSPLPPASAISNQTPSSAQEAYAGTDGGGDEGDDAGHGGDWPTEYDDDDHKSAKGQTPAGPVVREPGDKATGSVSSSRGQEGLGRAALFAPDCGGQDCQTDLLQSCDIEHRPRKRRKTSLQGIVGLHTTNMVHQNDTGVENGRGYYASSPPIDASYAQEDVCAAGPSGDMDASDDGDLPAVELKGLDHDMASEPLPYGSESPTSMSIRMYDSAIGVSDCGAGVSDSGARVSDSGAAAAAGAIVITDSPPDSSNQVCGKPAASEGADKSTHPAPSSGKARTLARLVPGEKLSDDIIHEFLLILCALFPMSAASIDPLLVSQCAAPSLSPSQQSPSPSPSSLIPWDRISWVSPKKDIPLSQFLLIPIHLSEEPSHWVLAVICTDRRHSPVTRAFLFDSAPSGGNTRRVSEVLGKLVDDAVCFAGKEGGSAKSPLLSTAAEATSPHMMVSRLSPWSSNRLEAMACLRQTNGADCGVCVCAAAVYVLLQASVGRMPAQMTDEDSGAWRVMIAISLVTFGFVKEDLLLGLGAGRVPEDGARGRQEPLQATLAKLLASLPAGLLTSTRFQRSTCTCGLQSFNIRPYRVDKASIRHKVGPAPVSSELLDSGGDDDDSSDRDDLECLAQRHEDWVTALRAATVEAKAVASQKTKRIRAQVLQCGNVLAQLVEKAAPEYGNMMAILVGAKCTHQQLLHLGAVAQRAGLEAGPDDGPRSELSRVGSDTAQRRQVLAAFREINVAAGADDSIDEQMQRIICQLERRRDLGLASVQVVLVAAVLLRGPMACEGEST